jgi:hypothetical protein
VAGHRQALELIKLVAKRPTDGLILSIAKQRSQQIIDAVPTSSKRLGPTDHRRT